ncbi:MAG: hypothetical protein UZ14_CFX002003123 [Chloroflexi bacterium OLB14]|nr:MAG: hypothetical protein UZ14_CFX002003123 [Chloroflexi bacterium OLB14]
MKNKTPLLLTFSLILFQLTSCSLIPTISPDQQIQQAVAATIAALPLPTTPPTPTTYPSPTPFNLAGLFCEYQFCIGHPIDVSFFDVSAQQNPAAPNTYTQGVLAAFNGNLFIQAMWQVAPGSSDPKFLLDTILDDQVDTASGAEDVFLVRDMNVMYDTITTIASPNLPFGGAAAWTCGDRVFAWKVYLPNTESARPLFDEALARFRCEK